MSEKDYIKPGTQKEDSEGALKEVAKNASKTKTVKADTEEDYPTIVNDNPHKEYICKETTYFERGYRKRGLPYKFPKGVRIPLNSFEPLTDEAKRKYAEAEKSDEYIMSTVGHSRKSQRI